MLRHRWITVKAFADELDVSVHTIRHYEARGIIPRAMRHPANGYRLWEPEQVDEARRRLQPRRQEVAA